MLRRVLQGLEAGEIDRRFDLLCVSAHVGSVDRHGDVGPAGLGVKRRDQPLLFEQGGIKTAGQLPQRFESPLGIALQLTQDLADLRRIAFCKGRGQAELDLEGDQALLRAVVEVPL